MKFIKPLIIVLLLGFSASGFSQNQEQSSIAEAEKQTVEITINTVKYFIPASKQDLRIDIFSIIGAKVATLNIKSGVGSTDVNLPQGYYIVKAEDTSRKIAVK
ncbi:T9SS C-terminal target domain-containing protein [Dysgonomonas sp. 216]|uniref:T9SS type A sorting domain-containing protein n=1 Tax=Dysgonomonas sp. 216 TaxID=2302934 RepID=UPI0013CF5BCF|nr:T9SS type A sorting domain-containing protein [Dysgonomonas sp. 216]NDW18861.1 T9SS C-terminal target domain-containing protein [Dysgonomonas sp. 216]